MRENWLERGSDSPYRTWQRADDELEIRNLVAGWLNQNWANPYTIAQEPEVANAQSEVRRGALGQDEEPRVVGDEVNGWISGYRMRTSRHQFR